MKTNHRTVAYVIDDLGYGGAQKQLAILVTALPKPFQPVVISTSPILAPFDKIIRDAGVEVIGLERGPFTGLTRLRKIVRILHAHRVDLVHGFLDAANTYAYAAARLIGKPVLLSHRSDRLSVRGARATILRTMLKRANGVLVNSMAGKEYLRTHIRVPDAKLHYIHNWITPAVVTAGGDQRKSDAAIAIGNIGRYSKEKRQDLLIAAFVHVLREKPNSKLVLMGNGPLEASLRSQVSELGVSDSVEFLEPRPDVESVLRRLDCLVLPSAYEGLANVGIEALANGIPLITSGAGDMAKLVVEGKTGALTDAADPTTIAATILRVISDEGLKERAAIEGPALVNREFAIARAFEKLLPLYVSLIERTSG